MLHFWTFLWSKCGHIKIEPSKIQGFRGLSTIQARWADFGLSYISWFQKTAYTPSAQIICIIFFLEVKVGQKLVTVLLLISSIISYFFLTQLLYHFKKYWASLIAWNINVSAFRLHLFCVIACLSKKSGNVIYKQYCNFNYGWYKIESLILFNDAFALIRKLSFICASACYLIILKADFYSTYAFSKLL